MTILRFLFFSFLYGWLFFLLGLLVLTPVMMVIDSVWPQQGQAGFGKVLVGSLLLIWVFLASPVLTFQVAKRRATTEPSLKQSLLATYFDSRLFLSTLPAIGSFFYQEPLIEDKDDDRGFEGDEPINPT